MSGSRTAPRVFTIPPGVPFLATLAEALIGGQLVPGWPDPTDPLSLAQGTVYLPTRRAARALAVLLAERAAGRGSGTILLPRIVPLGETADQAALLTRLGRDGDEAVRAMGGLVGSGDPDNVEARAARAHWWNATGAGGEKASYPLVQSRAYV